MNSPCLKCTKIIKYLKTHKLLNNIYKLLLNNTIYYSEITHFIYEIVQTYFYIECQIHSNINNSTQTRYISNSYSDSSSFIQIPKTSKSCCLKIFCSKNYSVLKTCCSKIKIIVQFCEEIVSILKIYSDLNLQYMTEKLNLYIQAEIKFINEFQTKDNLSNHSQ